MFAMLVSSAWVTSVVTVSFSSSCLDSMMALGYEAQVVVWLEEVVEVVCE